jgi:hypothetical protein
MTHMSLSRVVTKTLIFVDLEVRTHVATKVKEGLKHTALFNHLICQEMQSEKIIFDRKGKNVGKVSRII